jgi:hypothetical protein
MLQAFESFLNGRYSREGVNAQSLHRRQLQLGTSAVELAVEAQGGTVCNFGDT